MPNNLSAPTSSDTSDLTGDSNSLAVSPSGEGAICAQSSKVLALPAGRSEIHRNIRAINMKCFLMLCDMHRGIFARLRPAPRGLLVAARNILKSADDPGDAGVGGMWANVLLAYVRSFSDSRHQVLAAARLQGAMDLGLEAAGSIDEIMDIVPAYLAAAKAPEAAGDALLVLAKRLGDAAMTLETSLNQLLDKVEMAAARAKQSDDPDLVGRIAMEVASGAKEPS